MEYDHITELLKAAPKRMDDARELLEPPSREQHRSDSAYRHNCGAQYLAGYAVECVLKAYIIDKANINGTERVQSWSQVLAQRKAADVEPDLSGAKSHNLELLHRAAALDAAMAGDDRIRTAWGICCKWRPSLRYNPRPVTDHGTTEAIVEACDTVRNWLRARFPA